MATKNGGVPEAEVYQNGQFRRVDRYRHFRSEWTSQKDFISSQPKCWIFKNFLWILWKKSVFLH